MMTSQSKTNKTAIPFAGDLLSPRRHDIQHNGTQHNDIQYNDIQHDDI